MKVPLRFQVTEFDCGTVSLLNAFSYLFERKEIPAELVKAIYAYTLDCHDEKGNLGQGGTSREAIDRLFIWITKYTNVRNIGVKCEHLLKEEVTLEKFKNCIENGGVIFLRCHQGTEHYVIMTDLDEANAYIFDPYYLDETFYDADEDVKIIFDEPFKYNRIVSLNRIFSNTSKDFSIGEVSIRECVLIERVKN